MSPFPVSPFRRGTLFFLSAPNFLFLALQLLQSLVDPSHKFFGRLVGEVALDHHFIKCALLKGEGRLPRPVFP